MKAKLDIVDRKMVFRLTSVTLELGSLLCIHLLTDTQREILHRKHKLMAVGPPSLKVEGFKSLRLQANGHTVSLLVNCQQVNQSTRLEEMFILCSY